MGNSQQHETRLSKLHLVDTFYQDCNCATLKKKKITTAQITLTGYWNSWCFWEQMNNNWSFLCASLEMVFWLLSNSSTKKDSFVFINTLILLRQKPSHNQFLSSPTSRFHRQSNIIIDSLWCENKSLNVSKLSQFLNLKYNLSNLNLKQIKKTANFETNFLNFQIKC
jgi:hypothetical protein